MAEQAAPLTKETYAIARLLTNEELFHIGQKAHWSFPYFTHELRNACLHAPKFVRERNSKTIKRSNENESEFRKKYLGMCVEMGKKEFEKGKKEGEEWVEWWVKIGQLGGLMVSGQRKQVLLDMRRVVGEYERLLECFTYV